MHFHQTKMLHNVKIPTYLVYCWLFFLLQSVEFSCGQQMVMYGNNPWKSSVSRFNREHSTVNQASPNHQMIGRRNIRELGVNEGSFSDIFGNVRRHEIQVDQSCIHKHIKM